MLLMCKNIPVYDIDSETVLNNALLPGLYERKICEYAHIYQMDEI